MPGMEEKHVKLMEALAGRVLDTPSGTYRVEKDPFGKPFLYELAGGADRVLGEEEAKGVLEGCLCILGAPER